MSYSYLVRVYKTKATHADEFRNGHGTAAVLWSHLTERYLGLNRSAWILGNSDLWRLDLSPDISENLRACLIFTFDICVCAMEDIDWLADQCDLTHAEIAQPDKVNHWAAVAKTLRNHKKRARQIGVGINVTSVADIWDESYPSDNEGFDLRSHYDICVEKLKGKAA